MDPDPFVVTTHMNEITQCALIVWLWAKQSQKGRSAKRQWLWQSHTSLTANKTSGRNDEKMYSVTHRRFFRRHGCLCEDLWRWSHCHEKCDCHAVASRTWLKSYSCFIDLLCEVPDCLSFHAKNIAMCSLNDDLDLPVSLRPRLVTVGRCHCIQERVASVVASYGYSRSRWCIRWGLSKYESLITSNWTTNISWTETSLKKRRGIWIAWANTSTFIFAGRRWKFSNRGSTESREQPFNVTTRTWRLTKTGSTTTKTERKLLLTRNRVAHPRPKSTSLLIQMKTVKNLKTSLEPLQTLNLLYQYFLVILVMKIEGTCIRREWCPPTLVQYPSQSTVQ